MGKRKKKMYWTGTDGAVSRFRGDHLTEASLLPQIAEGLATAKSALKASRAKWFLKEIGKLHGKFKGFEGIILAVPLMYDKAVEGNMGVDAIGLVDEKRLIEGAGQVGYWVLADTDKHPRKDLPGTAALTAVGKLMEKAAGRKLPYRGCITAQQIHARQDTKLGDEAREGNIRYSTVTTNMTLLGDFFDYIKEKRGGGLL